MYGYVYLTENIINHKLYVGQHKSKEFDENYKGSGKLIKLAINKYGYENFTVKILKECSSKEELDKEEIHQIKIFREKFGKDRLYNIVDGGNFSNTYGMLGKHHTEESKLKSSISNKGQVRTEATKNKLSKNHFSKKGINYWSGRRHKESSRELISKNHADVSGKNNPMYGRKSRYMNNGSINKMIVLDKVDEYLKLGWKFGKLSYK